MTNYAELDQSFIERNKLIANKDFSTLSFPKTYPRDRHVYVFNTEAEVTSREDVEDELVITTDDPSWVKIVLKSDGNLTLKPYKRIRKPINDLIQNIQE